MTPTTFFRLLHTPIDAKGDALAERIAALNDSAALNTTGAAGGDLHPRPRRLRPDPRLAVRVLGGRWCVNRFCQVRSHRDWQSGRAGIKRDGR